MDVDAKKCHEWCDVVNNGSDALCLAARLFERAARIASEKAARARGDKSKFAAAMCKHNNVLIRL